ncbi:hypothetical protein Tco_0558025 [Tanacetum coccineum]
MWHAIQRHKRDHEASEAKVALTPIKGELFTDRTRGVDFSILILVSDSEEEDVPHAKKEKKTVKSSFAKIEFVKSKEQVKSPRKTTVKQAVVNAARPKAVLNAIKGNHVNAIKASTCWVWKPKTKGNPQIDLQDQGVIDSGCSRHLTGNMSYLTDFEEIDGGYVAFGGNPKEGKITGKGTIKTSNLDFENVYFATIKMKIVNGVVQLQALVDKKKIIITEVTIRRYLQLEDAEDAEITLDMAEKEVSTTDLVTTAGKVVTTANVAVSTVSTIPILVLPIELTTTTTTIPSKNKGKGIMVEEPLKMKKKDQISFDEQEAIRLQAEFNEEVRLAMEKDEANVALIEEWNDI